MPINESHAHGHRHGVVDPEIASTARGMWALRWSFVALLATALLQAVVVALSGSVALLADTIHNVADAATAIPLGIAFAAARLKPSRRFPYGYGRVEDLAGGLIILTVFASALVAGYEAVHRLLHPEPVSYLGAVAAASLVGFVGNEAVAIFRIRVGRQMGSAALVADGYHARVDGLTSLAVLVGAGGVWCGSRAARYSPACWTGSPPTCWRPSSTRRGTPPVSVTWPRCARDGSVIGSPSS